MAGETISPTDQYLKFKKHDNRKIHRCQIHFFLEWKDSFSGGLTWKVLFRVDGSLNTFTE